MKRCFDLSLSLLGIIFLIPVFIIIALCVRQDGGPAFFRQQRVGQFGKLFQLYKFRSMVLDAETTGALISTTHDRRITRVGHFLRKTKLDELPQLINVLVGDISLVGPRPEVPFYVDNWPDKYKKVVLSVKPGITDYATLYYNDEQAILGQSKDPEKTYLEEVMPHKLKMYEQYVKDQSFWLDFRILIATLLKMAGSQMYKRFFDDHEVGSSS